MTQATQGGKSSMAFLWSCGLYNILVGEVFCIHGQGWQVNRHSHRLLVTKSILLHFLLEVEYHDYAYMLA